MKTKGKPEGTSKEGVMYSGGDGEGTLKPLDTPFKGNKEGTADISYLSRPKAPSSQAHMHPLAAPPQNENAAGVFLEKLYLASLGTETVRSFERAWEGEEYVKKELYTKAEPETHDSGMNIKGEMKTRMQSDLELTKRCGK